LPTNVSGVKPSMTSAETATLTLPDWLRRLEQLHPLTIELGLERVNAVYQRLGCDFGPARVVIVGGTNGKGSTVTMLASALRAAGQRVGVYTSPHLLRYNERVSIDGVEASDQHLCAAFAAVEAVRGEISLTYFEFGTLAALWLFAQAGLDCIVLEIGLGGRLDAVNIVEPTLSILTNVALDHTDWLGPDRESIGYEKAGIFRAGKPALYGERDMPASVRRQATAIGANLLQLGQSFDWQQDDQGWCWQGRSVAGESVQMEALPLLPFPLDNAATVIQALQWLAPDLDATALRTALAAAVLPGRFQRLSWQGCPVVLDVAHNPHAAANLAHNIRTRLASREIRLVLGMLADKDSSGVLALLAPVVSHIHAASLGGERGMEAKIIYNRALAIGVTAVTCHASVQEAFAAACGAAGPGTVVVVTGSFFTVAAVLEML